MGKSMTTTRPALVRPATEGDLLRCPEREPGARDERGLAEPMRIRLFDRLRDGEATVHELAGELATSQQNISKHLTLLAEAGLLARRKERNSVCYRIADPEVFGLCEQVCGSVERHLLDLAALLQPPAVSELEGSCR
jgi:DNA-binding transcriptional ArsR family regulator